MTLTVTVFRPMLSRRVAMTCCCMSRATWWTGFVGYCYGEVHDCGPAQDTDGGVGVPVLEGGALGDRGELVVGAAAEGDADAGDHAGAVAGRPLRYGR